MTLRRVDLGAVDDFADGQARRVAVGGRGLVVVRRGADFHVLRDICPHQGARLSDGQVTGTALECPPGAEIVLGRDGEILSCPWHGWEFDVCSGRSLVEPDRVRVRVYETAVEDGRLLVACD